MEEVGIFMSIWYMLWLFAIFYDIWYIFRLLGMFFPFWYVVARKIWQPWFPER
jgi:hypothetical protein